MTFDNVGIISFNDELGNIFPVRDRKEFDTYDKGSILDVTERDELDEIASRPEIFGNGAEDLSTAIFEANVEKLAEQDFVLGRLKKIIIPIIASM